VNINIIYFIGDMAMGSLLRCAGYVLVEYMGYKGLREKGGTLGYMDIFDINTDISNMDTDILKTDIFSNMNSVGTDIVKKRTKMSEILDRKFENISVSFCALCSMIKGAFIYIFFRSFLEIFIHIYPLSSNPHPLSFIP
jgi:hypothetical protein